MCSRNIDTDEETLYMAGCFLQFTWIAMTSVPGTDEFPSARKLKENPLANVDLLENVFGAVHVSGAEGWTAQQGEDSLDKQGDNNDGDAEDTDVDQVPPTQDISAPAESRTAGPSSSRTKANRKRSRAAQVGQAVVDCLSD
ncbi:unnamed protein product, partial [Brassica rapa subsp. trilocularis]